jgi:hypothetical protein
MKFRVPEIKGAQFDNITCTGQVLEVPQGIYGYLLILGCAEWGNFSDTLAVEFDDGDTEVIKIEFTDWANIPVFGEKTAWQGQGAERTKDGIHIMNLSLHLFAKPFPIRTEKQVRSIKLPDCPNLHFFAITLTTRPDMGAC